MGDLAEGLVLARDLVTKAGVLLLPAGTTLHRAHLEKIAAFHRIDPLADRVFVVRRASAKDSP